MSFELIELLPAGIAYLALLFGIAHAGDRGWIPERVFRHPLVYVLSLGVFASAYSVFGIVGLAHETGYGYLSFYAGVAGTFLFAPLLLLPILRICRNFQLDSVADLLTFRFRSQAAGTVVSLTMLLAMLPLLAMQVQAVSETVAVLTRSSAESGQPVRSHHLFAALFCLALLVFAILFGSKRRGTERRHNGLVAAIAFEATFKLIVMLALGAAAVYGVFGGFGALEEWLSNHPEQLERLRAPMSEDASRSQLLLFFSTVLCMPHVFHMAFAEGATPSTMRPASWGVSIYLLLLSLPILPILWAGIATGSALPPEYFPLALGIGLDSPALALLTYLVALSAASGATIVVTLALASMCLNHLVLPFYQPRSSTNIYRWLLWIRRLLIATIILGAYLLYRVLAQRQSAIGLGMTAYIGTLQFVPGILATLYWPRANRIGLLAGMAAGIAVWIAVGLLPLVSDVSAMGMVAEWLGNSRADIGGAITVMSLGLNAVVFLVVSLLTPISDEERSAAEVCSLDDLNRPARHTLAVRDATEMKERLAEALGPASAEREVNRALAELKLSPNDRRPLAMRRLRNRLEVNLSGLMGPAVAHDIVNRLLPYRSGGTKRTEDIALIEARLERYQSSLTGLAADLDSLRRYHRQTLQDLPIGLCALGRDGEVLMWNQAMVTLTGIPWQDVVGSDVSSLPEPWNKLLHDFFESPEPHLHKARIEAEGHRRWISLHKTLNSLGADSASDGQVIVAEDMTETQLLEEELIHSERLASIGRLAAGVAHEIGNPVTGIACLAQNLKYDTDNPESLQTASEILEQTQRITRIVQSLVNFAHAGVERQRSEPEPVAVAACADEAIHLLTLNRDATEVTFRNECAADVVVMADHQRLQQVFINLLSNARDASPAGSTITVSATIEGERAHLCVTDQGSGIPETYQEQVFEPFFTTKDPGKGTGLGLALVYGILDEWKGEIFIESPVREQGFGTRIHLWLPCSSVTGV
ncbi:MAG: ATP-binding protein [Spongiibacteraceae bacterium]|jgi:PAS domain S-box-containing protein|nr:ATP-binding protein [Spongiibacteraceae bacterium]